MEMLTLEVSLILDGSFEPFILDPFFDTIFLDGDLLIGLLGSLDGLTGLCEECLNLDGDLDTLLPFDCSADFVDFFFLPFLVKKKNNSMMRSVP